MNYFKQLLESYFKINPRVDEQEVDPQARAAAESEATGLINNAKSNNFQSVPIPNNQNIYLKKSEESQQVSMIGLGDFGINVEEPDGYQKLVNLLMGDATGGSQEKESQASKATKGQGEKPLLGGPGGRRFSYFPDSSIGDPTALGNTIEKICKREIEKIDKLRTGKKEARRKAMSHCKSLIDNLDRLNNDTQYSIAQTFDSSTRLIYDCEKENRRNCETEKDKEKSIEHRIAAFSVIQNALDILNSAQQRDNKTLTLEECAMLKNSISITGGGKKKRMALVGPDKKGMLVVQDSDRTTFMHDIVTTLTKGVKCADGNDFQFEPDIVKFLTSAGISGSSGSILRGFFFEDLRAAVASLASCRAQGASEVECRKQASYHLMRWLKDKDSLINALQDLLQKIRDNGELSIQVDDEFGMAFINDLLPILKDSDDPEAQLASVLGIMARTATLGIAERRPFKVDKTANVVGGGKKSDLTEHYPTREAAEAALDKMNLPPEQRKLVIIKELKNDSGQIIAYTMGDSLKYSTSAESVKGGQAARSSMQEALADPKGNKAWFDGMKKSGITQGDLDSVGASITEYDNNLETLLNLEEVAQFKTKDGERLSVNNREKATTEIIKAISEKLGVDSAITQTLHRNIKTLISQGKPWEEIAAYIADAMYKSKLESGLFSDNPQAAFNQIATFAAFAGLSSDGTLLSVADGTKGKMYISAQNIHIRNIKNRLDKISSLSVEERKKYIKVNGKSVSIMDDNGKILYTLGLDKMDCDISIDAQHIMENSTKRSIQKGQEFINNSTNININQFMSLLVEQRSNLNKLIDIIAKGDLG